MTEVVWRPPPEVVERANATRLVRRAGVGDYRELVRRSAEDPGWFWPLAIEDMGLEFSAPWSQVYDDSRGPEWTTWFTGGRLSIAHNCVHRWAERTPSAVAAVGLREDGSRTALTFAELSREVTRLAEALVRLGVREGDRVAIFLPMSPEVAIASHACAHVGAIQVPIFSGFAAPAVAQRLQASEAKVAITTRESSRRGKPMPMLEILEAARREAPSVEHVVVAPWDELVADCPGEMPALEVDSETPYLLTYTSGTTGVPKGIVHVQGGFLVSIAREVCYQADVSAGDVVHFATDMGWIMGPWTVVGAGALGATIVFAEGAPDWPADRLWRTVEQERVTSLGLSPTLVRARSRPTARQAPTSHRCAPSSPPANRGTRARIAGSSTRSAAAACRSSTAPAAPRSARASSRRCRRSRSRRARSAGPRSGWRWTSSTTRDARSSARARSASSSAASRSPG